MSAPHSSPARGHPSMQKEFLVRDGSINTVDMFQPFPEDALRAWRAPSPFAVNFAEMDTPQESMMVDELLLPSLVLPTSSKAKRLAIASEFLPEEYQQRVSSVSCGSISSDPGMIEDAHGWSDSDISLDDEHTHRRSSDEIWDTFWAPHEVSPRPVRAVESKKPSPTSKSATSITGLRKQEARRKPAHVPAPLQNLSYSTYSAFPQEPNTSQPRGRVYVPHKSWPLPNDAPKPARPAYRSRSYTSPTQRSQVIQPSHLSTCTTANSDTSPERSRVGTPVYTQSAPVTPGSAQFPPGLMELMEKSVFEDDEDEDEEKTGLVALAARLHLRSASAGVGAKEAEEKRAQRKEKGNFRRSASDALKGVFGMKK